MKPTLYRCCCFCESPPVSPPIFIMSSTSISFRFSLFFKHKKYVTCSGIRMHLVWCSVVTSTSLFSLSFVRCPQVPWSLCFGFRLVDLDFSRETPQSMWVTYHVVLFVEVYQLTPHYFLLIEAILLPWVMGCVCKRFVFCW